MNEIFYLKKIRVWKGRMVYIKHSSYNGKIAKGCAGLGFKSFLCVLHLFTKLFVCSKILLLIFFLSFLFWKKLLYVVIMHEILHFRTLEEKGETVNLKKTECNNNKK